MLGALDSGIGIRLDLVDLMYNTDFTLIFSARSLPHNFFQADDVSGTAIQLAIGQPVGVDSIHLQKIQWNIEQIHCLNTSKNPFAL